MFNLVGCESLAVFSVREVLTLAGYYFGTGEEGLGYYRDLRQRRRAGWLKFVGFKKIILVKIKPPGIGPQV